MRGVVFAGDRRIEYMEVPDPTPGPDEVILAVKASGMCGSDLKTYRDRGDGHTDPSLPGATERVIGGHEPCGVVVEVGSAVAPHEAKVGDRAMVHHYRGCTVCDLCRAGWPQMCTEQTPLIYGGNAHGAHAPFLKVPARTLVPLPEELSFVAGAAISCGVGTAYAALMRAKPSGTDTVAIFGQGPVGLAGTMLAKAMGARVIALDISEDRLEHARRIGADETINPATADAVARIRELTNGRGADMALETSGAESAHPAAVGCLRPWGSVVLVGVGGGFHLSHVTMIIGNQISVIGSRTFSSVEHAECTRFVVDRGLDLDALFTHQWSLEDAEEAYRLFDAQTTGKGVFVF